MAWTELYEMVGLQALYSSGARKTVVFGLGPVGCSPLARASNPTNPGECVEPANELALGFNAGLKQLVDGIRVQLPGFNLVLANTFDTVAAIIADGKAYGTHLNSFSPTMDLFDVGSHQRIIIVMS
jgi:phospholipase/lecithinase/hemolysin